MYTVDDEGQAFIQVASTKSSSEVLILSIRGYDGRDNNIYIVLFER